jgi:HD-like signal output (HDOD) protein/CheY-like chemotaxis protein
MSADLAILFVDDEPNILSGLRRLLRSKAGEWRMSFAYSGAEALRLIDAQPFDAVVTDMRMPQMDGAELLTKVGERRPETIRIILSGQCDQEGAVRSVGPSHIFLSKPCEPGVLIETLDRALHLRRMIYDPAVRTALGGLHALPGIPSSYHAISHAVEEPNCSAHHIADLIGQDPAVAAALLHVANSAYFAPRRLVSSISQAVQYLGMDVVRAVVLSSGVFHDLSLQVQDPSRIKGVWEHSLRTAARTRAALQVLTGRCDPREESEAYTAGLLHDVGALALAAAFPAGDERLAAIEKLDEYDRAPVERATFGVDHGVIGGFLMGIWGLPDSIVEAIAYHHDPVACFRLPSLLPRAVCLAGAVDNFVEAGAPSSEAVALCIAKGVIPFAAADDPAVVAALQAAWKVQIQQ